MPFLPLEKLKSGACDIGVQLNENQLEQLDIFAQIMVETNRKFNLTRITDPDEIVTEHILDSFTILAAINIPKKSILADIGTGAGFPGIPLAIARPDINVILIDGAFKKVRYLNDVKVKLSLSNIEPVHARAEELGKDKEWRESFDFVCARALAEMKVLAELCAPLAKPGGHVIAQKGPIVDEELDEARSMIGTLGCVIEKKYKAHIPTTDIERTIIVLAKNKRTPPQFPRPYAKISGSKKA